MSRGFFKHRGELLAERTVASMSPSMTTTAEEAQSKPSNTEIDRATISMDLDEYTVILPTGRDGSKKAIKSAVDDPLIDTTATIPRNSKRTRRIQKQQHRRLHKVKSKPQSFFELPPELLLDILSFLRPSDVFTLLRLTRETQAFILQNEGSIALDILRRRYWSLSRCFPLPVAVKTLDPSARAALLNPRREKMLDIHWKPYQHIKRLDAQEICSCASCHVAWNQLNVILDLAYFQDYLNKREPIPMLPRGTTPQWNIDLIEANAAKVQQALRSPLKYAAILQIHLATITGTLLRQLRFPQRTRMHQHNSKFAPAKTVHPISLYSVTEKDAATESDEFLERQGRECFEVPFSRDNYYNQWMYAYMPNRKWRKEERSWIYGVSVVHDKDVAWARAWFTPKPGESEESKQQREVVQLERNQSGPPRQLHEHKIAKKQDEAAKSDQRGPTTTLTGEVENGGEGVSAVGMLR